ncbi:DUF305 domain-containing protein [Citrobacter meridianamericanus]
MTPLNEISDAGVRKLAEDIIRAHQPEIGQMHTWMKERKKH